MSESRLNTLPDRRIRAIKAFRVDVEQDFDGVAGPLGNCGRRDTSVESGGHGGMPQIVGCLGQHRCRYLLGEHRNASTLPGADDGEFR
jgi:hypothetical protein